MRDLLFTVGPVEMYPETLSLGGEPLPYFRTEEFSGINKRICENLKQCAYTDKSSKVAILTASGTAGMEAAVSNVFTKEDKVLIIVGGGFGQRFVEICEKQGISCIVLRLESGRTLRNEQLAEFEHVGITGILVNIHETTTGVLYDGRMIGEFSRRIGATLVVDAISSFLADEYRMDDWNIDVTIISSQKALALPPGLSMLIVNERTIKKIEGNNIRHIYFDLTEYFKNIERGQTPFTPAVGILLQLDQRLNQIITDGVEKTVQGIKEQADDFRMKIREFDIEIASDSLSNACTPIQFPPAVNAYEIFIVLKEQYHLMLCPSGGELRNRLLRVGHIGNLSKEHNTRLVEAFQDLRKKNMLG